LAVFSQLSWESRKVEHKQKGNDGGRPPTHPLGKKSYRTDWNYLIINSATDPLSPSPLNPSVLSEGDKDSCRPVLPIADRRSG
jgi:hypothetical protein